MGYVIQRFVCCNECGFSDIDGITDSDTRKSIEARLKKEGWKIKGNVHICDKCLPN